MSIDPTSHSRADWPDDNGSVFEFGAPTPENKPTYDDGLAEAFKALDNGTIPIKFDGTTYPGSVDVSQNSTDENRENTEGPINSVETFSEKMEWQERIEALQHDHGFLPTSTKEMNTATGVIPFIERKGGVGRHLNTVLLHNKKYEANNPQAAVKSIIGDYVSYYLDAETRKKGLEDLLDNLSGVNPELAISHLDEDEASSTAIESIVDHFAVIEALKTGDREVLKGGLKESGIERIGQLALFSDIDTETKSQIVRQSLLQNLPGGITVKDLRLYSKNVLASQESRSIFWRNTLESSKSHALARKEVEAVLNT